MQKLILAAILYVGIWGCNSERVSGNGNVVTQSRDAGEFDAVRLMGSMDVIVKNGATHSVELNGEDNILSYVLTEVHDGRLNIKYENNVSIRTTKPVVVIVTSPEFREVAVLGSGNIEGEGTLSATDKIKVDITGSGDIKLNLDAPAISAKITGSGDIELKGRTRDLNCTTTGSGAIKAAELLAENATAQSSGSGDISLFGSVKIDARVTGSGDIRYTGGGSVSSQVSGSGSIKQLNN